MKWCFSVFLAIMWFNCKLFKLCKQIMTMTPMVAEIHWVFNYYLYVSYGIITHCTNHTYIEKIITLKQKHTYCYSNQKSKKKQILQQFHLVNMYVTMLQDIYIYNQQIEMKITKVKIKIQPCTKANITKTKQKQYNKAPQTASKYFFSTNV